MSETFGAGELVLVGLITVFYLVPVAVVVWAVLTLRAIRVRQESLLEKVVGIERALQLGVPASAGTRTTP